METMKTAITPSTAPGAFGHAVGHATAGAHHEIESANSAGNPAVDRMAASAHEAVDKVSSVASHAVDTLGVKGEQLHAAEKRLVEGTSRYVRQHPVASLGIAIATGYVLSRIFASR